MINNNLSANTLFHFTRSLDNIIGILTNNFYPRLCMETQNYILSERYESEIAIPMVCFCDIPLSQIRNHIENYGGYAIGLSKDWGRKNKINPVMYTIPDSYPVNIMRASLEIAGDFWEENDKERSITDNGINEKYTSEMDTIGQMIYEFSKYLKPYEGSSWNKDKFEDKVIRFYDEREWRYIPNESFLLKNDFEDSFLTKTEYLDETLRNEYHRKLEKLCKLEFEPSDIKYIIVKDEHEVLDIEDKITRIKGSKYTYDEIRLLKTRILSMSQILSDF